MASYYLKNDTSCLSLKANSTSHYGVGRIVEKWEMLMFVVGFGVISSFMAGIFSYVRGRVYKDKDSLDVAFDAGGKVNVGLTATTIVSQWTWAATLLQSSAVAAKVIYFCTTMANHDCNAECGPIITLFTPGAVMLRDVYFSMNSVSECIGKYMPHDFKVSRYGIAGSFWYAAGASIQVILFSMLSVQLKIRAPGAKTFLQVIKARFDAKTHKVFCVFALLTNLVVTAMLMLGGAAVVTSIVKETSVEYATTLVMIVIGAYTFIGGLGATFYVSYVNAATICIVVIIFMSKIYKDNSPDNPLGSVEKVFRLLNCTDAPSGNEQGSFLTMLSFEGLQFGLINIVGNFGTVFVDQAYWQCSVAAKPREGVVGFLCGGISWFAVPFTFSTAMGLGYIALSAQQNQPLLTSSDIDAGLVAPAVATEMLGHTGAVLILVIVLMAITSTGSAEVMAVTSILVYDVYQIYLKPYRRILDSNSCILCGKSRGRMANPRDKCVCQSKTVCSSCKKDDDLRSESRAAIKPEYKCSVHGTFRNYVDYLSRIKNWCLLWTIVAILPLTVILYAMQLSLSWVYLFMGILVGSAVIPITLCMFWERLTAVGMISGAVGGSACALISWLSVASTYDGGLRNFIDNTGESIAMLTGNVVAIFSGGIISVVVSFITNRSYNKVMGAEIWEKTRDIDNPLSPWTELFARDLNLDAASQLDTRPPLGNVNKKFKLAKYIAYIFSVGLTFILIFVWPSSMISVDVLDLSGFELWVNIAMAWIYMATIFLVVVPVITESIDIYQAAQDKSRVFPTGPRMSEAQVHKNGMPMSKGSNNSAPNENHPTTSKMDSIENESAMF